MGIILDFKYLNKHLMIKITFMLLFSILGRANSKVYCQATNDCFNEPESNCLVLTVSSAVSRALNSNRQFLGTIENLTSAQYGIDLAESTFNISITPNSRAGYIGGDRGTPGWTIGGGVEFEKKFTTGTVISIEPSIVKTRDHYLTEIQSLITQPLLRGLGKVCFLAGSVKIEILSRD